MDRINFYLIKVTVVAEQVRKFFDKDINTFPVEIFVCLETAP